MSKQTPEKRPNFAKIAKVLGKVCDGFDISTSGLAHLAD